MRFVSGIYNEQYLRKLIKNNKDVLELSTNSGILKLNCGWYSKTYVGQTGKSFKTRYAEHGRDFIQRKLDSNCAKYLVKEKHLY